MFEGIIDAESDSTRGQADSLRPVVFSDDFDEDSTPEQLGCEIGDILRSYPVESSFRELFRIKHLSVPGTTVRFTVSQTSTNPMECVC